MAVKKATKKTAKKTYPPAKKTYPKLPRVTVDELFAIIAETSKKVADLAEIPKRMEADRAKTEALMRKSREETDKSFRELRATVAETSEAVHELNETVGGIGGHLGELVEFIVVPKIRPAINALGNHTFETVTAKKVITAVIDGGKRKLAEMDVFLSGATEAMAVETKTCLQIKDIDIHIERLKKLRSHEEDVGVKGKKLFGAVVGAIVHPAVKKYALKHGLYVVEIREEEDRLDIEKPEPCCTW